MSVIFRPSISPEVKKVKIISQCSCYVCPDENDEVEQHITIRNDGRYWLSRYAFGEGFGKFRRCGSQTGQMYMDRGAIILDMIENACSGADTLQYATDGGNWSLIITYEDGSEKTFGNSPCNASDPFGRISELIRAELDSYDLFLFDFNTGDPFAEYSALRLFSEFLPLFYANTWLWNRFQELCREQFPEKRSRKDFFAFHRDPKAMAIWYGLLDNMGGGIPLSFFEAAAYLLLVYKETGHSLKKELAALGKADPIEDK